MDKLWYKLARTIIKSGTMPFPITDTLYELLQMIITDEEAKFIITVFNRKPNLNLDEIKKKIEMDEEALLKILDSFLIVSDFSPQFICGSLKYLSILNLFKITSTSS